MYDDNENLTQFETVSGLLFVLVSDPLINIMEKITLITVREYLALE